MNKIKAVISPCSQVTCNYIVVMYGTVDVFHVENILPGPVQPDLECTSCTCMRYHTTCPHMHRCNMIRSLLIPPLNALITDSFKINCTLCLPACLLQYHKVQLEKVSPKILNG